MEKVFFPGSGMGCLLRFIFFYYIYFTLLYLFPSQSVINTFGPLGYLVHAAHNSIQKAKHVG